MPLQETVQLVAWREGGRRCELWTIDGVAFLRLYDDDVLIREEPLQRERALEQADDLRRFSA
jgi:hypothetical protein